MRFIKPESLDGLTLDEVSALRDSAMAEAKEINQIADDKISTEQTQDLLGLVQIIDEIDARRDELQGAATALADARARFTEPEAVAEEVAEVVVEEAVAEVEAVEVAELEPVLAAAGSAVARAAAAAPAVAAPAEVVAPSMALTITASANIHGFTSGQTLDGIEQLAQAFENRSKMFAGGVTSKGLVGKAGVSSMSANAQRFSVAQLRKAETEFTITEKMSAEDQFALIQRVANESRLGTGGIIAAGGWCAPSEQIWSFCELETMDGLLSIPEMVAKRGGVTWTPGPQLSDLLGDANFGFLQTEAQAEAGTVKPCYTLECPDWQEVRLDAIGFCIKAGILTNAAYPELIRRVLKLGLIAHARRLNAQTIARISTALGAATAFANVSGTNYSSTSDLLSAIELNVIRVREEHAMAENATMEAVFPLWVKAIIRAELSRRRGGLEMLNVSDQLISQWFATRGIAAQFVRDYQPISSAAVTTAGGTAGWTRLPNKVEFMLYPAGAFVRLGTDVIDLDTVYDTDGLTHNTYTAAFFEEGFNILNTCGTGVKVSVTLDNVSGLVGADLIGAPVAP